MASARAQKRTQGPARRTEKRAAAAPPADDDTEHSVHAQHKLLCSVPLQRSGVSDLLNSLAVIPSVA